MNIRTNEDVVAAKWKMVQEADATSKSSHNLKIVGKDEGFEIGKEILSLPDVLHQNRYYCIVNAESDQSFNVTVEKMPDPKREHELGEVVQCHRAFAVYKDYDGNSPDTDDLVICATKELADQVATFCNFAEQSDNIEYETVGLPFVDGWEFSSYYNIRPVVAEKGDIVTTFGQAVDALRT